MDKKFGGSFSLGLKSLELQVGALLEGCGGDKARALLDALSELSPAEQDRSIDLFLRLLERLSKSDARLPDASDEHLKEFEETLYQDLLGSVAAAVNDECVPMGQKPRKLELVSGRKEAPAPSTSNRTIDFNEARRRRSARSATFVN